MSRFLVLNEHTSRLKFRKVLDKDFKEFISLFKDKSIVKYLGLDDSLSDFELCKKWFDKTFERYDTNMGGMNALVDKNSGKLLGQCGLLVQEVEGEELLEVGYSILPNYWNNGYASEAAIKCKNFAFERNFSDQLVSLIHTGNIASENVAKKNGMVLDKKVQLYGGRPFNLFRIDKDNWIQNKKNE